ncbi:hypothetical protein D3C75_757630 [compost metagenome]
MHLQDELAECHLRNFGSKPRGDALNIDHGPPVGILDQGFPIQIRPCFSIGNRNVIHEPRLVIPVKKVKYLPEFGGTCNLLTDQNHLYMAPLAFAAQLKGDVTNRLEQGWPFCNDIESCAFGRNIRFSLAWIVDLCRQQYLLIGCKINSDTKHKGSFAQF